jgi:uncharacterized protein (DUF608 family)
MLDSVSLNDTSTFYSMKSRSDRRSFLKKITVGGAAATIAPTSFLNAEPGQSITKPVSIQRKAESGRVYNGPYTGEFLKRVAFPIGGLGAGMFCLEGTGAFSHMSVSHKPEIFHEPGMFAALCVKGMKSGTKVIEGPSPDWKKFGKPDAGNGSGGTIYGLPKFHQAEFLARFPFGMIKLEDEDVPVKVSIEGWSPFIPTDADNSSLPVGALEYQFRNTGNTELDMIFSFNSRNFMRKDKAVGSIKKISNGFVLSCEELADKPHTRGDFSVYTDQSETVVDHCWFRGGWFDPLTITWETIRSGEMKNVEPVETGAPGASLYVPFKLAAGEEKKIKLMMTWYVPSSDLRVGEDGQADANCDPASGCCTTTAELGLADNDKPFTGNSYKPWYSNKFPDVYAVADYFKRNYDDLKRKSELFRDAFYSSTLPAEVIEAVAANLTILKSPTVMRQFDGRLWSFEGCGDNWGCCHGSCTHVWNYAQAIPHLFPALERTLRHTEFCEGQDAEGHQTFRANMPIRQVKHEFHAAADGQLGGIMKVYREWRISGDNEWLKKMYPMVKKSMDYCIKTWDPRGKGIIEEPHHNTYDIEFWGPDGMCTSFYLGALNAMIKMGKQVGQDVKNYKRLFDAGKKFAETELYDGEYFYQKIQTTGLNAKSPTDPSFKSFGGEYSAEAKALLEKEGPKYQYGKGCLSDGVLGGWISRMCGLEEPLDVEKTKSHLLAVHKYNLKKNLSDHANPQRPSFAMGDEGGLLLCSWPKGGKLSLPFVYSDEVWTGIEYQVASHLMLMGKVEEGLEIIRTCRKRYDGRSRNPFNEYECGHWYARALSSYGFLQGLTGVRYDAVDKTLYIDSKIGDFTTFLSTEKGFGTVSLKNGKPSWNAVFGEFKVSKVLVSGKAVAG